MADVSRTPFEVEEFVTTVPIGADEAERTVIAHEGGINGFNTVIARVIEDRHLVVLLNNTGDANLRAIQNGILDLLYGREPPLPKPPVAEAYMTAGETELAIQNYAKSLELNPENTNAVRQLMRLTGVGE